MSHSDFLVFMGSEYHSLNSYTPGLDFEVDGFLLIQECPEADSESALKLFQGQQCGEAQMAKDYCCYQVYYTVEPVLYQKELQAQLSSDATMSDDDFEIQFNHPANLEIAQQPLQAQKVEHNRSNYADFVLVQQPLQAEDNEHAQNNHADFVIVQQPSQAEDIEQVQNNHANMEIVQQHQDIDAILERCTIKKRSDRQIAASRVRRRQKWSHQEDGHLMDLFHTHMKWTQIAKELNQVFHSGNETRTGRACRERWISHLDPNLKSNLYIEKGWTDEETSLILYNRDILGHSWSSIARLVPGRTEHQVKNRYNKIKRDLRNLRTSRIIVAVSGSSTEASDVEELQFID